MTQRLLDAVNRDKAREIVLSMAEAERLRAAGTGWLPGQLVPKNADAGLIEAVARITTPNDASLDDFNTCVSCEEAYRETVLA